MAPEVKRDPLRRGVDLDRFGLAVGHVAIDTPGGQLFAELVGHPMLAGLMTRQTLLGEPGHVALRIVNVVAGPAPNGRGSGQPATPATPRRPNYPNVREPKSPSLSARGEIGGRG